MQKPDNNIPQTIRRWAATHGLSYAKTCLTGVMPSEAGAIFTDANVILSDWAWQLYSIDTAALKASPGGLPPDKLFVSARMYLFTAIVNGNPGPFLIIGPKGRAGPPCVLRYEGDSTCFHELIPAVKRTSRLMEDDLMIAEAGRELFIIAPGNGGDGSQVFPVPGSILPDVRVFTLEQACHMWAFR